jgi:hypothetical protein
MGPAQEDQLILPNNYNHNSNNINPNKNIKKKGYRATRKHTNELKQPGKSVVAVQPHAEKE